MCVGVGVGVGVFGVVAGSMPLSPPQHLHHPSPHGYACFGFSSPLLCVGFGVDAVVSGAHWLVMVRHFIAPQVTVAVKAARTGDVQGLLASIRTRKATQNDVCAALVAGVLAGHASIVSPLSPYCSKETMSRGFLTAAANGQVWHGWNASVVDVDNAMLVPLAPAVDAAGLVLGQFTWCCPVSVPVCATV